MVIRQGKEIKGKHTGKEGKLSVFTSDMFHYTGSPKEFILKQMSSTGYRIEIRSIYKNLFYFFMNDNFIFLHLMADEKPL